MTNAELTAIRADLDRRASWQRMSSMEFIRNVKTSDVTDLNRRLIRAVPVLVAEVERLQLENAKLRAEREMIIRQNAVLERQWSEHIQAVARAARGER